MVDEDLADKDMPDTPSSPFWDPKVHADRRPALLARGRIVSALRAWFAAEDFVEVETGALQVSPGNEMHLHAFATTLVAPDGSASPLYLRTSPEFACKKLLAAGERRIVEFAKVFRNRERGALHAPEFTLVEWYRAGEPYQALMADCAAILAQAAEAAATKQFSFRGRIADPFAAPERLTVAEAFEKFAGIDLLATLPDGKPDRALFARAAQDRRHPHRRRRPLGRYFQPRAGGAHREQSRHRARDHFGRISRRAGGAGAHVAEKSAGRRTLRDLCLRRRTRQRLRRAHRRRRAAAPAGTRDGGERTHLRRALSARRGFFGRAGGDAGSVRHRAWA